MRIARVFERLWALISRAPPPDVARSVEIVVDAGDFELVEAARAPGTRPPGDRAEVDALTTLVRERLGTGALELPGFPPLATQIFALIERPDFELNQLVQLVRRDPVVATEVLSVANSMLFAAAVPLESLRDAVIRLGARETAQAATSASVRALFDEGARVGRTMFPGLGRELWQHALVTAFGACWASLTFRRGDADRVFLAGLLHDIGKTVAMSALCELLVSASRPVPPALARDVLGALHVEAWEVLARKWHVPDGVRDIIRAHHDVARGGDDNLLLVRLVSGVDELVAGTSVAEDELEARSACAALGLSLAQQRALVTQVRELRQRAAKLA